MHIKTEGATAKITNWNPRTERHGEEEVMAGDIDIVTNQPVEVLGDIAVDLVDWRGFLYKDSGEVRSLCLEPLRFHREFTEMELAFLAANEDDDVVLSVHVNKVKKIVAEIENGYRVNLKFQAQVEVDRDESGAIHELEVVQGVAFELQKADKQADIEDNKVVAMK